jgi:two-component system, response regulator, stage 0 sporulation protein F
MKTILHVEDDKAVRLLYQEVLEELGYSVVQVPSAEVALKILKSTRPDLIILDLKMPGMGGGGFLERLRTLRLTIPVVVSTAYPHLGDEMAQLGAAAYVVKSGDLGELIDKVSELLGAR